MDTTTLSRLIDSIYDAGLGNKSWHEVMAAITAAFGEQNGILYEFDAKRRQSRILGSTAADHALLKEYEDYYGSIDDWNRRILLEPTHDTNATHNLIRDAEFERTEFCNDYLRQLDLFYGMGSIARRSGERTTVFGVQRSRRRGHFSTADFRNFALLVRHVDRSLEIAERLERATRSPEMPARGTVLLKSDGTVAFVTEDMLRLMGSAGIALREGRLRAEGETGAQLAHLLQNVKDCADRGRSAREILDIPLPAGGTLSLVACDAAANAAHHGEALVCLLLEHRPQRADAVALLRQRYRLTSAEAALAVHLAEGRSLTDVATARRISVNTLRVQLQAVFAKTGCHRQSELVGLVLRLPTR